jgi:hypothetical protein
MIKTDPCNCIMYRGDFTLGHSRRTLRERRWLTVRCAGQKPISTPYQHSLHSMYVCVMFHNVSALLLHAWVTIWPLAPSALAKRRHSLKGEIGPK